MTLRPSRDLHRTLRPVLGFYLMQVFPPLMEKKIKKDPPVVWKGTVQNLLSYPA